MKRHQNLFSQMRNATRHLLGSGPAAATSAIQHALNSLLPGHAGATQAAPSEEAGAAQPAAGMRDINPPPAAATAAAKARDADATRAAAAPAGQSAPRPAPSATPGAGATAQAAQAAEAADATDTPQTGWAGIPSPGSAWTTSTWPGLSSLPKFPLDGAGGGQTPQEMTKMAQDFAQDFMARLGVPNHLGADAFDLPGMGTPAKAPPAPLAPGAQFIEGSFSNHAGQRDYKLYIPSSYAGQPMSLLVMLHGCTQNPDDFAAGTQMNAVAEEKQCFVVYPAQPANANSSRCWNWFNALDQQRDQGEPSIIAGIAEQIIASYPVDRRQVYVAGLSAGGAMAVIVGTLYPDLFAAVGVHSGLPFASARDLPSALAAMRSGGMAAPQRPSSQGGGLPIIVFHGDRDNTVNPRNGEELIAQGLRDQAGAAKAAASVDSGSVPNGHRYTRTSHRHQDGTPLGEHWVIHGAGHAWSGGSDSGSYTDGKGPDASREMMRFFETVA